MDRETARPTRQTREPKSAGKVGRNSATGQFGSAAKLGRKASTVVRDKVAEPAPSVFAWPASFEYDEDGRVVVSFPDLPEALTDGADRAEALSNATDCLDEAIAGRLAAGEAVPTPSRKRRLVPVPLPVLTAAKFALHRTMADAGITNTRLAVTLGVDEKEVRRMLDPRHATRIDRIELALARLGRALQVSVVDQ